MKLRIKESSWSGWTKDYKPEEIEKEYELKDNEKYIIKQTKLIHYEGNERIEKEEELFSFDITEITDNSITIKTYQPFSDYDDNTINLRSDKKEFMITTEKPIKLVTPTTDFGYIFILTLLK